ncbi:MULTISPECIES: HNH endonuclease [unclassified Rhodococcus (in: high G+C Gram-positive bacteria)]|uniref:HNH endonuclease n=1 Tax=unclassified Rhodococcus (in: high G+C Gram-positive bacteria) TaxID=192944 RepID=UPI0029529E76|nr:HNH endonuclease [Rhodococcus sp. IEGM 1343]MDV8058418.1 HNH endonuclease [Rhodococcus sp. IEGM 1343]
MSARTGHRTYRARRARLKRTNTVCALCGREIDPELKWPDPGSFSADHITPVSKGGHNLGPLQAAHLGCNSARGNRTVQQPSKALREW